MPPSMPEMCRSAVRLLALAALTNAAAWTWQEDAGLLELRTSAGTPLWAFHWGSEATKPYVHPLTVGGGPSLTAVRPADHPWHLGLWFSWKFINGVNYWEEDRATGRPAGLTTWTNVVIERFADGVATIALDLAYRPSTDPHAVLHEHRCLRFSAPTAEGGWTLDWDAEFTVVSARIELAASPVNPARTAGGYAGLLCRVSTNLTDWRAVDDRGRVDLAIHGEPAGAVDVQGRVAGRDVGIAILDHPSNPGSPCPWFLRLDRAQAYALSGPGILFSGPRTYEAGARWRLRYRVIAHPGAWTAERLRTEWDTFRAAAAP